MDKKLTVLLYATAATTLIAGLLHINKTTDAIGGDGFSNSDILFLVGGITQVIWAIPIIRQWGKIWYAIGIVGTIAFVLIWVITRIPGNPITGKAGPIGGEAIVIQVLQISFIILSLIVLISITKVKKSTIK